MIPFCKNVPLLKICHTYPTELKLDSYSSTRQVPNNI